MGDFRMPSLGADMEVGTIVEWRVRPGDPVHRGDIIAVVDTEKSTIDVEVFEDGVVDELVVEPGVEVPVGTVLAHISTPGEATQPAIEVGAPVVAAAATHGFVRASPMARREAAARAIDLTAVAPTGPGGAVTVRDLDVEPLASTAAPPRAAAPPPPSPPPIAAPRDRQASMRRAIGAAMARSKKEIPHYYLATTIDLTAATAFLTSVNERLPVAERLLPAVLLLKATARAAREVPVVNGFFEGEYEPSAAVHVGVAISLRTGGLVAPAIHNADQLELSALMAALRDVVQRARAGGLRSSEMTDATITVTNLGDTGVDEVFGVIYPPQVAIVGFGRIVERPWALGPDASGRLALGVRPVVRATLSADHRVSDGHDGGRFLTTIDRLLQRPEEL